MIRMRSIRNLNILLTSTLMLVGWGVCLKLPVTEEQLYCQICRLVSVIFVFGYDLACLYTRMHNKLFNEKFEEFDERRRCHQLWHMH